MLKRRGTAYLLVVFFFLSAGPLFSWDWVIDPDVYFDGVDENEERPPAEGSRVEPPTDFQQGKLNYAITTQGHVTAIRSGVLGSDGFIYGAGRYNDGTSNSFAILRFFADGTLDSAFSNDGVVIDSFGSGDNIAHALVIQTDGRPVAVGRSNANGGIFRFSLLRLLSDGSLDTTFATTGKASTAILGSADIPRAAAIDTTAQKIVVAGYALNGSKFDLAIVRYTSNGALDTSFRSTGKLTAAVTANDNSALAVGVDFSGRVIAAGPAYDGTRFVFGVARFLSSGVYDTTFNSSGFLTVSLGTLGTGNDRPMALTLQTDASVIIVGSSEKAADNDAAILKLLSNGLLDTTFSRSGKITTSYGASNDVLLGIRSQSDSSIVVGGFTQNAGGKDNFLIARYTTAGLLDTSFNSSGSRVASIQTSHEVAQSLDMLGDDVIMLFGRSTNAQANWSAGLMRFDTNGAIALGGAADYGFGTTGIYKCPISGGGLGADGFTLQTDGRFVMAGNSVWRINPRGELDTSFSTDGYLVATRAFLHYGVSTQTDGKVLVGGWANDANGSFLVVRLESNGLADTTFNRDGSNPIPIGTLNKAKSLLQEPDGSIVAGGFFDIGFTSEFGMARFFSNGVLDTAFATAGVAHRSYSGAAQAHSLLRDPNGKYFLGGHFMIPAFGDLGIIKYNNDGTLDTSFQSNGVTKLDTGNTDDGRAIGLQQDGKIVGVGGQLTGFITRFTTDGRVDTTFGGGTILGMGKSVNAVAIQPNQKVVGAGATLTTGFQILRYLTDGGIDSSFASTGNISGQLSGSTTAANALWIKPNGKICMLASILSSSGWAISCYWP